MELRELAKRTGCSFRRLRYVVEHEIVPPSKVAFRGRGSARPRLFSDSLGVLIACAAHLLDSGVKRELVKRLLDTVPQIVKPLSRRKMVCVWEQALEADWAFSVCAGDGRLIRLKTGAPSTWDSGWLDMETLRKVEAQPTVVIHIEVGPIRDRVVHSP